MNRIVTGDVWFARVPYNDTPRNDESTMNKLRPVVVLGASPNLAPDSVVLVAPITSFGDGGSPQAGDIRIEDTSLAGLSKQSWVRARRVFGMHPRSLDPQRRCNCGRISSKELDAAYRVIAELLG